MTSQVSQNVPSMVCCEYKKMEKLLKVFQFRKGNSPGFDWKYLLVDNMLGFHLAHSRIHESVADGYSLTIDLLLLFLFPFLLFFFLLFFFRSWLSLDVSVGMGFPALYFSLPSRENERRK